MANPVVAEIQRTANLPLTQDRSKGFSDSLKAAGIKVSNRGWEEYTVESGQQATAKLLQANRKEFIMVGGAGSKNVMEAIKADNTVLTCTVTDPPSMASSAIKPAPG